MRSSHFFEVAAAVGLAAATFVPAAAQPPPSLEEALARIQKYAPQAMQEQGAPGLSVAITDRKHVRKIITLGYANLGSRIPVTPETRFAIGSITKGMTALALMELRDEGHFDPAKPVAYYLPWFSIRSGGKTIYAHQLLSHTAGLPDDWTVTPGYMYSVAALRQAHTIFAPGSSWSYSNDAFATLGAILAGLDGLPWADALQARVLNRLGMSQSSPVFTPQTLADAALGYQFEDMNSIMPENPRLVASDPGDFVDPAGSVLSTPEDMAKYMRFLLNGGVNDAGERVLSESGYRLLTTPDTMNGKPAGASRPQLAEAPLLYQFYAFGLGIHDERGDRIVAHTGGISGYTACMENDVTRGFGVIAMSNLIEAPLHPCAIVLYAIKVLQAQSAGEPLLPLPAPIDRSSVSHAANFAGTYTAAGGTQLVFSADESHLYLQSASGRKLLFSRGEGTFWTDDARFGIFGLTFLPGKGGKVDQVISGSQWFASSAYSGSRAFSYPRRWQALLGRYDTDEQFGTTSASRVIEVKGHLTLDGTTPLTEKPDGSFVLGSSTIRFDTLAAGRMQRMRYDGIPMYRIDLP